jgi:hypothetical protein
MLFERLRKARGLNFRDLTFENFKGINVTPEEMWIEYADHRAMRYFEEQVLRKRPYLKREWCELALKNPVRREVQLDGRIRQWVFIEELSKYLRLVTLEDGETVLNAFPDRNFKV